MVKRILSLIQREVHGLHEAAYVLAIFALGSQFLALIRDRMLASQFGAGEVLDVYYAAFRIPDFIFVSIASLVSLSVLIPFLTERIERSKDEARRFLSSVFSIFSLIIISVSVVIFFAAPTLLTILFPGIANTDAFSELVLLTRILLLQPILLGFSSLFASVVHVYQKFVLYAISPLLYNIGILIGIFFFHPLFGSAGLAYGVILGALMHLLLQMPFIVRQGFLPTHVWASRLKDIRDVAILSLPRTLALSANQIALIVLVGMASLMETGSIAVFNFSFNLQSVPLAIIGASYSVAAFPTLTRLFSEGNHDKFLSHIATATRHIIFWAIPATVLFIMLRAQIVRVILGSGEFSWTDTRLTAAALALFVFSLLAHSLVLLYVRGYYAAGETRKPLIINVISSICIVLFAFGFLKLYHAFPLWQYFIEATFRVEDMVGTVTSILMLPLGYSLAVFLNAILLWFIFQKDFAEFSSELIRTFFESLSASIIMGFAIHHFLDILDEIFDINTFLGIFAQGFFAGLLGLSIGVGVLVALRNKEVKEVWQALHHKFWKVRIISSE